MPEPTTSLPALPPVDPDVGSNMPASLLESMVADKPYTATPQTKALYKIGTHLKELLRESCEARATKDADVLKLQNAVNLTDPGVKSLLGNRGPSMRVPLVFEMKNAIASYLVAIITGQRPFFRADAVSADDTDAATSLEAYWDDFWASPEIDFKQIVDQAVSLALDHGTCFLRVGWDRSVDKARVFERLTPQNMRQLGFDSAPLPPESLAEGSIVRSSDGGQARIGQIVDAERMQVVTDRPSVDVISYFDFISYPARSSSVERATCVGHRFVLSVAELRRMSAASVYDPSIVAALLLSGDLVYVGPSSRSHLFDNDSDEDLTKDEEGLDDETSMSTAPTMIGSDVGTRKKGEILNPLEMDSKDVELFEGVYRVDADFDGFPEDWLVTFETSTGMPIRFQRYPMLPGSRPYIPVSIYQRSGSLYGMPLARVLEGAQHEADIATNMALEAAALSFTYLVLRNTGSGRNAGLRKIQVGINERETTNPADDFVVHRFGENVSAEILPNIDIIRQMAERVTAASEGLTGVGTSSTDTATEANQIMAGANRRLALLASRVWRPFVRAQRIIHDAGARHHLASGMSPDEVVPSFLIGSFGRRKSSSVLSEWLSSVEFVGHGDTINTNPQLQLQAAEKALVQAASNPLIAGRMSRIWQATSYFLRAYGIRNVTQWIGTPQEAMQEEQQPKPKTPQIPPNVNEDFLATYLADNPDDAQKVIEMIQMIASAKNAGKEESDIENQARRAELDIEKAGMGLEKIGMDEEMDHEKRMHALEMGRARIGMEAQKAGMGLAKAASQAQQKGVQQGISLDAKRSQIDQRAARLKQQQARKPSPGGRTR